MAETTTLTRAEKREKMRALGLSEPEIDALIGPELVAETDVRANTGEDTKFGITSIYKVYGNGTARSRMGLKTAEAHVALIKQLQARYADLDDAEDFTPFALVTAEDTDSESEEG